MIRIDARGMRCPWPAIRLARALRDGANRVEIDADDPRAHGELTGAATAVGATLTQVAEGRFRVERRPRAVLDPLPPDGGTATP